VYLKELSELSGISGDEGEVRDFIKSHMASYADEMWVDNVGNLLILKKGRESDKKVLIAAHMDEVGMMVVRINEDGTLGVAPVGGLDVRVCLGKRVRIGDVHGVIGYKAIHLQKKMEDKFPAWRDVKVFCGFKNKDEAAENVKLGDYVYFTTTFEEKGEYFSGKAFDDRGGCSILMDLLSSGEPAYDTIFAFLVQEETGLRGSSVVVEQVKPDVAIVVETTTAGDVPELEEYKWATHLGDGPAVTFAHRGYVVDPRVFQTIVETAEKAGIRYQYKRRTAGGTDAFRFARSAYGVPAGVVSIPCRYIHSPVSLMRKDDYHETLKLMQLLVMKGEVKKAWRN